MTGYMAKRELRSNIIYLTNLNALSLNILSPFIDNKQLLSIKSHKILLLYMKYYGPAAHCLPLVPNQIGEWVCYSTMCCCSRLILPFGLEPVASSVPLDQRHIATFLFLAQYWQIMFDPCSNWWCGSDVWEYILKNQVNIFHLLWYFESFLMADLCTLM